MSRKATLISLSLLGLAFNARADWVVLGAAYRCEAGRSFALLATMDTSSPSDPGTVLAPEGFSQLKTDEISNFQCLVGKVKVNASIRLQSPKGSGMCAGSGDVSIDTLEVNGKPIVDRGEPFNMACSEGPAVVSVRVEKNKADATVEVCRGEWDWGRGYHTIKCVRRGA